MAFLLPGATGGQKAGRLRGEYNLELSRGDFNA